MSEDMRVSVGEPEVRDALTELLRMGARELVARAVQAELDAFLAEYESVRDERGHRHVVRNGYLRKHEAQTSIGSASVRLQRVRARAG